MEKDDGSNEGNQEGQDISGDNVREHSEPVSKNVSSKGKNNPVAKSLREQAEEAAIEQLTEETATTTNRTSRYNRSDKIKRYVKNRADGVCEGCGEPAPFRSKTGDPYLHAHHIHELANGGSDRPESVIALCPNCHYKVHHGEDGEEYNRDLIEQLADIEDVPVDSI